MKQIAKGFIKGLGQIGEEAGKEALKQGGKIIEETIDPKAFLGDIKPMTEGEYAQRKREEDERQQKEMASLRAQISGRNVESEIKEVRDEKEQEEKQKEQEFLAKLQAQRDEERAKDAAMEEPINPHKKKKKRGGAFLPGKKQQASDASMSATGEFKGKVD